MFLIEKVLNSLSDMGSFKYLKEEYLGEKMDDCSLLQGRGRSICDT